MTQYNKALFTATTDQTPFASYKKVILGQVAVTLLDPLNETEITGVILKGDPRKPKQLEDCIIDTFNETQDRVFRKLNKRHLDARRIVPYKRPETEEKHERTWADYTDEELLTVLGYDYTKLQKTINTIDLPAVLAAMIELAEDVGKSKRTMKLLESKLSELQQKTFTTPTDEV